MKKATKFLSLLIVVVLLLTILTGCALFGTDSLKLRNTVILKVGDEEVTAGKVMDIYISSYYNYESYIQQGAISISDLVNLTMETVYNTYSKVDSYKKSHSAVSPANQFVAAGNIKDIEYLTELEADYIISYVRYNFYQAMDSYVKTAITGEIGDLGTETDTTDREFYKTDDFTGTSYADYLFQQNLTSEDIEEYLADNFGIDNKNPADINLSMSKSDYANASSSEAMAAEYNKLLKIYFDSLEDDDEHKPDTLPTVTAAWVLEQQEIAFDKYARAIKNSYEIGLEEYFLQQVADGVVTTIAQKYSRDVNETVETDAALLDTLKSRFINSRAVQQTDFTIKPSEFVTFIGALTNDSYMYAMDNLYDLFSNDANRYIFVKNILVPFSAAQTKVLSNYAEQVGGEDTAEYIAFRTQLATEISARNFDVADEKAADAYIDDVFTVDGSGNIALRGTALSNKFAAGSNVGIFNGSADDFVSLMGSFNTDVGQHGNLYEYVVRVGTTPDSYTQPWVSEFVDAANLAYDQYVSNGNSGNGYALCVSSYGVHIVYFSDLVENKVWKDFDESKIYDPASNEYKFLKAYYEAVVSTVVDEDTEKLDKEYKYAGKITTTKEFDTFLRYYEFEYDFAEAMKDPDAE
jgi:hypothetical protein